jgi:hypothetical protein
VCVGFERTLSGPSSKGAVLCPLEPPCPVRIRRAEHNQLIAITKQVYIDPMREHAVRRRDGNEWNPQEPSKIGRQSPI